ncbi:MAG: tetratricopeptide repeat protein [Planctomycetes bacterium]|nr:tetratricopeptide repeat protein [Planctomycetota bacterium]
MMKNISIVFLIVIVSILVFFVFVLNDTMNTTVSNHSFVNVYEAFIREDYSLCKELVKKIKPSKFNAKSFYIRAVCELKTKEFYKFNSVLSDLEKALELERNDRKYIRNKISSIIVDYIENRPFINGPSTIIDRLKPNDIILLGKAIECNPSNHKAYYYRGMYYYENDDVKAIDDLNSAINVSNAIHTVYYIARARTFHYLFKNYKKAIDDYKRLTKYYFLISHDLPIYRFIPRYYAYLRIGECYLELNNEDDALKSFDEAKSLCPYGEYADFEKKINDLIQKYRDSKD